MQPAQSGEVIRASEIIVLGANGGEFIYDAAGNLRIATVGQDTVDPLQGIPCKAGQSIFNGHGAVILLNSITNNALFLYFDKGTNVQGAMVLVGASALGTDPITGASYTAGQTLIDPAFADSLNIIGATIKLQQLAFTRQAQVTANTAPANNKNPYVEVDAPEQVGTGAAGHMQFLMQGNSPDGTQLGQALFGQVVGGGLLTPQTNAMLEVQANLGTNPAIQAILLAAGDLIFGGKVTGDTANRFRVDTTAASNTRVAIRAGAGTSQDTRFYNSAAGQWASDPILANVGGVPDSWNSLGALGAHYTVNRGVYRLTNEGMLFLDISVTGDGLQAGSVTFANTLPAAYRPAFSHTALPMGTDRQVSASTVWPRLTVTAAGAVTVINDGANSNTFTFCGAIPLDTPS